jgi:dienelactone hydrolase
MRLITTLLLVLLLSNLIAAQEQRVQPSTQTTSRISILLHDEARQKDLPLLVTTPKNAEGSLPVIIFCHGAGGSGEGVTGLTDYWASQGYACIAPTHDDSIKLQRERGQLEGDTLDSAMQGTLRKVFSDRSFADNRVKDVKLILDSFARIETEAKLAAKLDPQRIGVGGHSFGAHTTMCIGGMQRLATPAGEDADARPKAFLVLSGQGTGRGLTKDAWKDFNRPMLSMTGSRDTSPADGKGPDWRRENYDLAPPGDKYFVFIEGAHHGSFVGSYAGENFRARAARRALRDPNQADVGAELQQAIFDDVKHTTLAFWNAYLQADANAKATLLTNEIARTSNGRTRVEHK